MPSRSEQRETTRAQIVDAALLAFAELGFGGASTREIARRAKVTQSLLTYHFPSKEKLWLAAADQIFSLLGRTLAERLAGMDPSDPRSAGRAFVREYVRFAAAHPELFRFMIEEGKHPSERLHWLVENHLKPGYRQVSTQLGAVAPELVPHVFYILAGAGSAIFAVPEECRRVTGLDPRSEEAIERHADLVARMLIP